MLTTRQKRRLTYVTIGFFFLLGGIEYAVILPTVWLYLSERFDASPHFLGLVLSAFSLADLLASPLIGRWSDKTGNTRLVVLVANIPQCIGSIMYFLGINPWFLVASRFVVGLGSGACAALLADVARVTTREERTSTFSILMSCRQLGLLIGPGCNLFLMHINFTIGPFRVDSYSIPGLFMAILWILHELLTVFLFWNLASLRLQERVEQSCSVPYSSSDYRIRDSESSALPPDNVPPSFEDSRNIQSDFDSSQRQLCAENPDPSSRELFRSPPPLLASDASSEFTSSNDYMEVAEQYMGGLSTRHQSNVQGHNQTKKRSSNSSSAPFSDGAVVPQGSNLNGQSYESVPISPSYEEAIDNNVLPDTVIHSSRRRIRVPALSLNYLITEFLKDEIIAILATVFIGFFNQVAFETMLTPLTRKFLGWKELENSLLYFGAGIEIVLVFLIILPLSRRFRDRTLMLFGFVLESVAITLFLWFVPQAKDMDIQKNLPVMLVGIFVDLVGLPLLIVTSTSLYSKITKEETQGFAQGLRRVFAQFGMILGPLWAGSMLDHTYWMFGVMLAVNLFSTCLLLLSFVRLKEPSSNPAETSAESEETEPLLS